MPLNTKSFLDFFRLITGKFNQALPTVDPTITPSIANANSAGSAIAGVGLQDGLADGVNQMFWQTADDDFLELIGGYDKTTRYQASVAIGYASVEGTVSTIIPTSTNLTYNGNTYQTLTSSTILNHIGTITLTSAGTIATAISTTTHNLASGFAVTISGATNNGYNGSKLVTVIDDFTFLYFITSALPSDSASYSDNFAILHIQSVLTGSIQNIPSGGKLNISVTGAAKYVYVQAEGITGGEDLENINNYRSRIGMSHSLIPGISTIPTLIYSAKKISGNTRVFVIRPIKDITGGIKTGGIQGQAGYYPQLGETIIYILRDNDNSIIPTPTELLNTKNQILADNVWSTMTPDDYLYVLAPQVLTQDFYFSMINPNTATMKASITTQLKVFFQDNASIGNTITIASIESFLLTVQDTSTGQFLKAFNMGMPSADLIAGQGQIFTVGSVTFA
jgi:uncharacterized phage protein gp47/JayE